MLNNAYWSAHKHAAREGLDTIRQKPLHHLMTIAVISLTLVFSLLLYLLIHNVANMAGNWQQGGHITLYLQSSKTPQVLLDKLRTNTGIQEYTFKSPEQGMQELMQQEGMQDLMQYLPENPLPAAVEITPSSIIDTPEKLEALFQELQQLPEVEQVKLDKDWAGRLHTLFTFSANLTLVLMGLLALAVLSITGNSLRLTIHSRQQDIQVLKLVGATDAFILRPFLYQGVGYGLAAALLAYVLVTGLLYSVEKVVYSLFLDYKINYSLQGLTVGQILILFGVASILGWFGARLSVKRQLVLIEPQ